MILLLGQTLQLEAAALFEKDAEFSSGEVATHVGQGRGRKKKAAKEYVEKEPRVVVSTPAYLAGAIARLGRSAQNLEEDFDLDTTDSEDSLPGINKQEALSQFLSTPVHTIVIGNC